MASGGPRLGVAAVCEPLIRHVAASLPPARRAAFEAQLAS
jgi:hypothetical protein